MEASALVLYERRLYLGNVYHVTIIKSTLVKQGGTAEQFVPVSLCARFIGR